MLREEGEGRKNAGRVRLEEEEAAAAGQAQLGLSQSPGASRSCNIGVTESSLGRGLVLLKC